MKKMILLLIVLSFSVAVLAQEYNITSTLQQKYTPVWAPNSSTVAFYQDVNGTHTHIFLGNVYGSNYDLLNDSFSYSTGDGGIVYSPANPPFFNYAGAKVGVTSQTGTTYLQLYTLNITPAARNTITSDAGHRHIFTDWSPDGQWLTYLRNTTSTRVDIYKINSSGGTEINLTTASSLGTAARYRARYSPDGTWIAYEMISGSPSKRVIARVSSSGGAETIVAQDTSGNFLDSYYPEISPDGQWVSFFRYDPYNFIYQIYKANASGAGPEIQMTSCSSDCVRASWSPDGSQLAYEAYDTNWWYQIAIMNATDVNVTTPYLLTNTSLDHYTPMWSSDGTKIAFTLYDWVSDYEIGVFNLTGPTPSPSDPVPEFSSITLLLAALVALGGIFAFRRYR